MIVLLTTVPLAIYIKGLLSSRTKFLKLSQFLINFSNISDIRSFGLRLLCNVRLRRSLVSVLSHSLCVYRIVQSHEIGHQVRFLCQLGKFIRKMTCSEKLCSFLKPLPS